VRDGATLTDDDARRRRVALAMLSLAAFASTSAFRVCDPMLPQLAEDFATTTGKVASVITIFSIAYGAMQLVYGQLGDHYGKFRVVALATLACAAGGIACATATSLEWLLAARLLAGATGAAIVPLSMAWIGDNVPYERRQETIARFLVGSITGMSAGSLLGGAFTDTIGWRGAFVALAVIYLVVGVLLLREHRRQRSVAAAAPERPGPATQLRFWSQTRIVLATPWARVVLVTVMLEGLLFFGALSFVPVFLHVRHGVSLLAAGTVASVFGLGGLAYVVLAPRLLRRLGESGLAKAGGVVLCAGFLALRFAPGIYWTLPAMFALGLAFFMLHNTLQTNATQMVPAARGTAVSTFASALFLGQSIGVALAAWVVDAAGTPSVFIAAAIGLPLVAFAFVGKLRRRPLPSEAG
jgi:predicted MFS family arabinose efflux permease